MRTPDELPPNGTLVHDAATGRVGVLRDTLTFTSYASGVSRTLSYLAPEEGGREWETDPKNITAVPSDAAGGRPWHQASVE